MNEKGNLMNIGYLGDGTLAATALRGLSGGHQVLSFNPNKNSTLEGGRATAVSNLSEVARSCNVIFVSLGSHAEVRKALFATGGLAQLLEPGKILVDQTPADPDQTRALADELRRTGVVLIDAPIHCERMDAVTDAAAIMCGGPADIVDSVRPLLESICGKVVYCGETGNGQAARLVVAAVAVCNRLITYECAAVGVKNGLAVEHMATVLNRSSGYNSASARILPVLAAGGETADIAISDVVNDLKMASGMGMKYNAPMLIANAACCIVEGAATELGGTESLDAMVKIFQATTGIDFENPKTWGIGGA